MDHLITYTRKIAVELKRRKQNINKRLNVEIRKTGVTAGLTTGDKTCHKKCTKPCDKTNYNTNATTGVEA